MGTGSGVLAMLAVKKEWWLSPYSLIPLIPYSLFSPYSQACRLIYRLIINRETGLRVGVLLENIDKEKMLKYLNLY